MTRSTTSLLTPPPMTVIASDEVAKVIDADRPTCVDLIRKAYLAHDRGDSVNPHSSFLRFPHRPNSRIISLPAYLGGGFDVAGIKWISSFPDNTGSGLERASAVMVLNDTTTGFPYVCMEASIVSASRTAASAVLGAEELVGGRVAQRIGFVGTGLIAGYVWRFLRDLKWEVGQIRLFDADPAVAVRFANMLAVNSAPETVVAADAEQVFAECDVIVLATVAGEPHLHDPALLANRPVVLHLSLRDLSPDVVLAGQNITDDVDHAVRERTSLHLAEQLVGHRDFVDGTIADVLTGRVRRDPERAAIYAPFGLGVLDLAVGQWVHAAVTGSAHIFTGFFPHQSSGR